MRGKVVLNWNVMFEYRENNSGNFFNSEWKCESVETLHMMPTMDSEES